MYLLTNRYAIHVLVILVAFGTGVMSVQASDLRTEDFGQGSILYNLASDQFDETIIVSSRAVGAKPTSYLGRSALSVQPDIDFHNPSDSYVAMNTETAALTAPTIAKSEASIAPRTETIEYVVKSGDSVGTIAQDHGISLNTLLWSNDLSSRSLIKPGDTLKILPANGVEHTVKSGDTLIKIAKEHDAKAEDITEYNHLADKSDLKIGETIFVPDGKIIAKAPSRTTSVSRVFTSKKKNATGVKAPANITSSGSMMWPTDLHVITQYYGWRHTGVDIDCLFTNKNYAADDGYVQFSGWKGGYGYAVEINHGNGLVTRYGHHKELFVKAGQHVNKGDALGICGTTGHSTGTHLHFEVIRNGKFTNPLEYVR